MTTYRIGSGAGYAGDRIDPALDLAERTIALAQLRRAHDPQAGYDPMLKERVRAGNLCCLSSKLLTSGH